MRSINKYEVIIKINYNHRMILITHKSNYQSNLCFIQIINLLWFLSRKYYQEVERKERGHIYSSMEGRNVLLNIARKPTRPNQQPEQILRVPILKAMYGGFQRTGKVCGETNLLSSCCYALLGILEET